MHRSLVLALALALVAGGPALADPKKGHGGHGQGHGKGPGKGGHEEAVDGTDAAAQVRIGGGAPSVSVTFGMGERDLIASYYRESAIRADSLPPGIAKNLARGKRLPPGIAKKQIPHALLVRLPPIDDRYARVVVGRDVLMIEVGTGLIVDILRNVLG